MTNNNYDYTGSINVILSEDGDINSQIWANSEGQVFKWTTDGYKPQIENYDELPEWVLEYVDEDFVLQGE
ncbi:MAG: hypothetical protein M3367_02845 [Acidobacteriota bacterium]|nr:hypothetical protein [Acidobacteriota bacterium]